MAFNFNWSPLTADASFYQRARDLLTTALNKSPKPPIIVDDIIVTEFNLGSIPPELEILEIGDLAEDRFRGIFKMCYSGDAFLTLKTRVQANPLNTYLSAKPSFTSPQPLAAASGLTIPLQITLSDIKLSAFIILVFSKQKGLTLVFRNDPLESLKVSSTFDSIQFVRDYLQRTIEGKLRDLMMEELPAIIHRLSLQLWCPDQLPKEQDEELLDASRRSGEQPAPVDPFASPPLDAVDAHGNVLDASEISQLSLHGSSEVQTLFSQKNLLRLATLTDSNRTLSLFTPGIRDVVFRAWTGPLERSDATGHSSPLATPSLAKSHSFHGATTTGPTATTYTFSDTASTEQGYLPSRPSLVSLNSATTGLALGSGRHSRSYMGRKKKRRVVNLRKAKGDDGASTPSAATSCSEMGDEFSETSSVLQGAMSEPIPFAGSIPEEPEEGDAAPVAPSPALPIGGAGKMRFMPGLDRAAAAARPPLDMGLFESLDAIAAGDAAPVVTLQSEAAPRKSTEMATEPTRAASNTKKGKQPAVTPSAVDEKAALAGAPSRPVSDTSSVILEQAWIMKMAGEIARRVYDEKQRNENFWADREDTPPPAYEASQ